MAKVVRLLPQVSRLFSHCSICGQEREKAYWDVELECYLYMCDRSALCCSCKNQNAPAVMRVNASHK